MVGQNEITTSGLGGVSHGLYGSEDFRLGSFLSSIMQSFFSTNDGWE